MTPLCPDARSKCLDHRKPGFPPEVREVGGCALNFTREVIPATQQGRVRALSGQDTRNHKTLPPAVPAVIHLHALSGMCGREPDADSLLAALYPIGEREGA